MANNTRITMEKFRKLVVVGDGMCGKTSLLYAFMYKTFDPSHTPTICDSTNVLEIEVDGKTIGLTLFDTVGQEDFDRLRPLSYPNTDVVLICFCVDNPVSASNVIDRWMPEIQHYCGKCPVILVACKIDLRIDPNTIEGLKRNPEKPVTTEAGKKIVYQIKADAYMECSAKTREGVEELFVNAARLSFKEKNQHKKSCKCVLF